MALPILDKALPIALTALCAAATALANAPFTALTPAETMLFILSTKPIMEPTTFEI